MSKSANENNHSTTLNLNDDGDDDDEFKIVVSKRKKNKKHQQKQSAPKIYKSAIKESLKPFIDNKSYTIEDCSRILRSISKIQEKLLRTNLFIDSTVRITKILQPKNSTIEKIICFGIGSFSECQIARHQLAYILAIQNYYKINHPIEFHEPILNNCEIESLKLLNCKVYEENLEGKYFIEFENNTIIEETNNLQVSSNRKILTILPHCAKQLTNNFLWKNWSANTLTNLILINNSFSRIYCINEHTSTSYVNRIIDCISEYPLSRFSPKTIFNDLSIHTFNELKLNELPLEFWQNSIEPTYTNHIEYITDELIRNSLN